MIPKLSSASFATYEMFNEAAPTAVVSSTPRPSSSRKPCDTLDDKSLASSRTPPTTPPTEPIVSEISTSPTTIVAPVRPKVIACPPVTSWLSRHHSPAQHPL
jgi:hypothetical protein